MVSSVVVHHTIILQLLFECLGVYNNRKFLVTKKIKFLSNKNSFVKKSDTTVWIHG